MANSNATTTRNVLCDLPDFPAGIITFSLRTYLALEGTEGFPQKEYSLTLSATGQGTQALPTPSSGAWLYEVGLPDGNNPLATLAAGADIQLTAWLSAALSTETANELTDSFVLKAGDTMTGLLTLSGAPTADLHASTKKYVDDTAQPLDAGLTDLAGLPVTDGNIPVGDGANWVAESGATARASLGAASLRPAENEQTGTTYTLALTDEDKIVQTTSASAVTVTVPPNSSVAFAIGAIVGLEQYGAGLLTVAAGAGVTIRSLGGSLAMSGQYGAAALRKIGVDEWLLVGALA